MTRDGLTEYRCTRNAMYHHNCIGKESISARQGHYCFSETIYGSVLDMVARFPDEILHGFTFTNVNTQRHYSWDAVNGIKDAPDGMADIDPRVQANIKLFDKDLTIKKFLGELKEKKLCDE